MSYECKYVVGEIAEKANEFYEERPDVMEAICSEAVRAWKTGYRKGLAKSVVAGAIGGATIGMVILAVRKIKDRKKIEEPDVFEEY